jgi:hypothetical protein
LLGGSSPQAKLTPVTLPGGGTAYVNSAGYGYAVLQNWLVASTALKKAVASIQLVLSHASASLASSSVYQAASAGLPAKASATAFFDITAIRTLLEGVLLPSMSKADIAQYQQVRPLLVPLKALESDSSAEDNGKTLRTNLFLLISK